MKLIFRRHWFLLSTLCILLLATLLRFYSYGDRWAVAYDHAHDVLVARYAVENSKIPLLGPFSSAGPFQTGGQWYWFIMAGVAVYRDSVLTPWILLTLLSIVFVYVMIRLGSELLGKSFGLLVGVLSAVSTGQIAQSLSLTNQSPISLLSALALLAMVRYVRERKVRDLFFLGFFISLAATIHLQGVALSVLLFATIIFTGLPSLFGLGGMIVGIFLPLIPLLIFDMQAGFLNSRNMLTYYLRDQYNIPLEVLGRRWLTYAGVFWPNAWAHVIGGKAVLGYVSMIAVAFVSLVSLFRKRIEREWLILFTSFLGMVVVLRYTRTPLFDSYLVFLHPFIFLLVSWAIFTIFSWKRVIGILFLLGILGFSLEKDIKEIIHAENFASFEANVRLNILNEKFPDQKFAVYAYQYKWSDKNLILSLFLDVHKKIDNQGRKIGVVVATQSGEFAYPIVEGNKTGYQLLDLESSTSGQLSDSDWVLVNPSAIYRSTEEWYSNK